MDRTFNNTDRHVEQREYDAQADIETPIEHDGRSPTRTGFDPNGKDGYGNPVTNRSKWYRLLKQQDGHRWPDSEPRRKQADRERWIKTVCSKCDIPQSVEEEACEINETFDYRFGGWYSEEELILGMLVYLIPETRHICEEESFQDFITEWGSTVDTTVRLSSLVARRLKSESDD